MAFWLGISYTNLDNMLENQSQVMWFEQIWIRTEGHVNRVCITFHKIKLGLQNKRNYPYLSKRSRILANCQ